MRKHIAFKEGINNPAFDIAVTMAFIGMMDANGLRKTVGKHAIAINHINRHKNEKPLLRERIGHSKAEILARICVGICVGYILHFI